MTKTEINKQDSNKTYNDDEIPSYLSEVYNWAYVEPKCVKCLDHDAIVYTLLFLNTGRLIKRYLNLIEPGMRVWQVAHVYGSLVTDVAKKVGENGEFFLTDCTSTQLVQAHTKLSKFSNTTIIQSTAESYINPKPFDLVCSFMLLHEVPDEIKQQVVDRMLESVSESGTVVFVDYHNPNKYWQPFRAILQLVNRYLEPFSNALWQNEIHSYASNAEQFEWTKETIFGGVYQCVTAKRKKFT